jgi:hypothetical protein
MFGSRFVSRYCCISGYYILNGRIDKVVVNIDKDSNEVLKAIRAYKRGTIVA